MARKIPHLSILAAAVLLAGNAMADVKVAYIEALSGPFANIGDAVAKGFQMELDAINAKGVLGGQKIELVKFDNKGSPQESLIVLKSVIDQGIRYISQGNSSAVANALSEAVAKHNSRNPDKSIVYLNFSAVDPDLTNSKCNFWHFRFDANSAMKMDVITNYIKNEKSVKKVYIIGQDYSHGHQVSKLAKELLAKKRPDIQIVGDDLHPIGRVKDFAPYVAKIKASGADTVITGNWGNDLTLLIKAAKDSGLTAKFYTYYAAALGSPAAMGEAGADRVFQISEWHANITPNKTLAFAQEFKKVQGIDYTMLRGRTMFNFFAEALNKTGSADPLKVARTMEDMHVEADTGDVWMRKSDHQLLQPLFLSVFEKVNGQSVKYDSEGTGYGWKTVMAVGTKDSQLPTTCVMERP